MKTNNSEYKNIFIMDQWLNFERTAKHKIGGGADNRIKAYDRY